jgi:CBS domain-containing protein
MRVKQIMNHDVVHCRTATPISTVAAMMKEHNVGIIPVLHENTGFLAGVITDRDLCLNVLATRADPKNFLASECMAVAITFCKLDDTIEIALKKMSEGQVRRLPVLENGLLAGIITLGDVIRADAAAPGAILATLRRIHEPAKYPRTANAA